MPSEQKQQQQQQPPLWYFGGGKFEFSFVCFYNRNKPREFQCKKKKLPTFGKFYRFVNKWNARETPIIWNLHQRLVSTVSFRHSTSNFNGLYIMYEFMSKHRNSSIFNQKNCIFIYSIWYGAHFLVFITFQHLFKTPLCIVFLIITTTWRERFEHLFYWVVYCNSMLIQYFLSIHLTVRKNTLCIDKYQSQCKTTAALKRRLNE